MLLENGSWSTVAHRGAKKGSFRNIKRIRAVEAAAASGHSGAGQRKPTLPTINWLAADDEFNRQWREKYGR